MTPLRTILVALVLAAPSWAQDINTGLVAHWKLDDSAANTTVTATVGSNATLAGGENTSGVRVAGPGGQLPYGFELDGNDSIDTGAESHGGVDLFADSDNWTVAWWSKVPSTTSGTLIAKAGATANQRTLQIFVSSGTAKPGIIVRGGSQSNFNSGVDDDAWHHWALVWNGTTATLYKDGASQGTATVGTASIESQNIKAGARTNTPAIFLTGSMSDMRIYSRALSGTDVTALYNLRLAPPTFKPAWARFANQGLTQ
jgi:hypothetical protein